jgi:hypothetical protein
LYSPWILKQISSDFGINLIEFPPQNLSEEKKQPENRKEIVCFFERKIDNLKTLIE